MKKISALFVLTILSATGLYAYQVSSYNLNVGDSYLAEVNQTQEISQMVMGNPNAINTTSTSIERVEVVGVNDDVYTLTVTTLQRRTEVSSMMGTQVLDSEDPSTGDGLYAALKDNSYSFTMDKKGEILSIEGLGEMIEAVKANLGDNPAVMAQVDGILNEETIRSSLKQRFSFFPGTDQTEWTKETELSMNSMPILLNTSFSYQTDSVIKAVSTMTIDATTTQMGMNVDLDLSGEQTGTYSLNESTGFLTEFESTSNIAGNASAQGMQIPMTIKTDSKVTFTLEQ